VAYSSHLVEYAGECGPQIRILVETRLDHAANVFVFLTKRCWEDVLSGILHGFNGLHLCMHWVEQLEHDHTEIMDIFEM
jgi:hypothetical protein